MGENRTVPIMLFVLGLFLIAIAIYLIIYNPQQNPVPPHRELGSYLVIAGVVAALTGLLEARRGKSKTTVKKTQEQPPSPPD